MLLLQDGSYRELEKNGSVFQTGAIFWSPCSFATLRCSWLSPKVDYFLISMGFLSVFAMNGRSIYLYFHSSSLSFYFFFNIWEISSNIRGGFILSSFILMVVFYLVHLDSSDKHHNAGNRLLSVGDNLNEKSYLSKNKNKWQLVSEAESPFQLNKSFTTPTSSLLQEALILCFCWFCSLQITKGPGA